MIQILLIAVMFVVCMVLHKPGMGFKFFLFWLAVCAAVFYLVDPSVGLWGFLCYFIVIGGGSDKKSSPSGGFVYVPETDDENPRKREGHTGTAYNPGGNVTHISGGGSTVRYGNMTYGSNRIRSRCDGEITYYWDDNTGKPLGRSVDHGNGVHTYFDDDGRELGHSYTSGKITDFFGDCFETR